MKKQSQMNLHDAEIKLGLISPTLHYTYPDKSINAYFTRISKSPVTFSDGSIKYINVSTLKGWRKVFLDKGFEGLQQRKRSDLGQSRKIDSSLALTIEKLRYKYPKMPATCMRKKLIEKGYISDKDFSESTMQRFFKNNPLKDIDAGTNNAKDRRAFEAEYVNGIWLFRQLAWPLH